VLEVTEEAGGGNDTSVLLLFFLSSPPQALESSPHDLYTMKNPFCWISSVSSVSPAAAMHSGTRNIRIWGLLVISVNTIFSENYFSFSKANIYTGLSQKIRIL